MALIKDVVSLHMMVAYNIPVAVLFFCSVFIEHLAQHGLICGLQFMLFFDLQVLMRQGVLVKGFFA